MFKKKKKHLNLHFFIQSAPNIKNWSPEPRSLCFLVSKIGKIFTGVTFIQQMLIVLGSVPGAEFIFPQSALSTALS